MIEKRSIKMSKQDKDKWRARTIIEDLPVDEARQDEVKGGRSATDDLVFRYTFGAPTPVA
jgi:hypothetical protein